jgi:hypothetical protein
MARIISAFMQATLKAPFKYELEAALVRPKLG